MKINKNTDSNFKIKLSELLHEYYKNAISENVRRAIANKKKKVMHSRKLKCKAM